MTLITQHALGIILWGSCLGSIAVWIACEWLHARKVDVLPKPQPDSRDKLAEWRRILEETET